MNDSINPDVGRQWDSDSCTYVDTGELPKKKRNEQYKNQSRIYQLIGDDDVLDLSFISKICGIFIYGGKFKYNIYFKDGTNVYMESEKVSDTTASRNDLTNSWTAWHDQNDSPRNPVV